MHMTGIPFGITDWSAVEPTEHAGTQGVAYWRTRQFGDLRVRLVEYSPGYLADHWCSKGHILFCIAGELRTDRLRLRQLQGDACRVGPEIRRDRLGAGFRALGLALDE